MNNLIKVRLSLEEFKYLLTGDFLSNKLVEKISDSSILKNDIYILEVSEDDAGNIRDFCGEQLQKAGFDEQYNPTKEGLILESLIDKFFI